MEEVKETFETIEEQYSKLKFVLENDRDGLFKNTDLNEAQVIFRVLDQKLNFVMDVSNLDAECMSKLQAIMLHITTEEAKFFARCGNELKGANILLDAIRATAVRSTEFPLICLRAANVCAALLIHHDCSGSVETAASVVRRAVEDYKAAEEQGLATCKLSGEQLLHTLTGHQMKDGDTERECRDAVSTALLLLAVGHGRMACQVLHQPFLQHALSVQLLWPSEHLDRRRWTIAALSLAACFIDSCRLRAARRYLCAAGYMLQQEINSKNNALPDVNWFKSIQTLLRHLFELIVGYALGVFRTSRPYWDGAPQKSQEQSPRSRDLACESSTAGETDTEFTEAPGSAQFEDDEESLDLGAKLGKLVQEADRRLIDTFRKTIAPSCSPFDEITNATDSTPSTCLIDASKDPVDIDEFAITELNLCTGGKSKSSDMQGDDARDSFSAFCGAPDQMVVTDEAVDIDDFAIPAREVDDESSDHSEIDETAISTPSDPLEKTESIDRSEKVNTPMSKKDVPESTCRRNVEENECLPAVKGNTSDDPEVEIRVQGSRSPCEQKDGVDVTGGAMEVSEEAQQSSVGAGSLLAECDKEKEQEEAAPEEGQQSLLRSGAGDCECSVQVWSPAAPFGREDAVTPLEEAETSPEACHPLTSQTSADADTTVGSGPVGCTEADLQDSKASAAIADAHENEENSAEVCRQEAIGERGSGEGSQQPEDEDDDEYDDDDDDQWEDICSEGSESEGEETWCAPSTAGGDGSSEDGLDLLDMGEWEAAIPPPPVRSPSDAAVLLEAGCCWLERYKTAVEGRFHKQLLLNIAELMRHAARFLPYGRIRKRLLRAAVRRLHAARGLCDGSGDATERRVLCGLSQALLELRLSGEGSGGAAQLHAAAEALSRLSAALHDHANSQLLLQLHIVRDVIEAPFGS